MGPGETRRSRRIRDVSCYFEKSINGTKIQKNKKHAVPSKVAHRTNLCV